MAATAVSASPQSIPSNTMPLISPPALLQAYLSQAPATRPSSRSPTQTRSINLNTGSLTHCNGSSLVRLGETTIVCGIRAEILPVSDIPHYRASESARSSTDPYEAVILNNLLVPNLELSTNSHPSFPANVAPSITAQSLSQKVLSLLQTSKLVAVEDLEIRYTAEDFGSELDPDDPAYVEPEKDVLKAYWVLYMDCVCLSYGGQTNVFDTTTMAIIAALKDVRLPKARWDEDEKIVICDAEFQNARKLQLNGLPCPLGFGVFVADPRLRMSKDVDMNGSPEVGQYNNTVLVDTDIFEDEICDERGNIVVDCSQGFCDVLRVDHVGGRGSMNLSVMVDLFSLAQKRWQEWQRVLQNATGSSR